MRKAVEYLIVGQGLSGSFMAMQLLMRGKSFQLIDKGLKGSSSSVAAGIINPIVLKRLTLTWRSREFLAYNPAFYEEFEKLLGKKYHFPTPLNKLISSEEEQQFWKHRYEKEDLADIIEADLIQSDYQDKLKKQFLMGRVKQTSWLNINALLADFRAYLKTNKLLIEESFNFKELQQKQYGDVAFNHLLFCEGAGGTKNPFFKELPFALNIGQLMTIKAQGFDGKQMLKKKVFMLPLGNDRYKVGATFSWKWEKEEADEEQSKLLKSQFDDFFAGKYVVEEMHVGIRPAIRDRRPLIGRHHKHDSYYIFNGMGSKGCLLAPLLTAELVDFIEYDKALHPEMNIDRFYKKMGY